jgi:hypothetical protein
MLNVRSRRVITGAVALTAGVLVNQLGDYMLGVDVELWWGLGTFDVVWMIDMFVVPFIAGVVVAVIFGLGGKWLCYFPPVIVRAISYFSYAWYGGVPDGAQLLTFPLWVLIVILVVEAAAFGGVAGEIIVKRTYGRMPRHLVYKQKDADKITDPKA